MTRGEADRPVRIAIVGCGRIGRWHARCARRLDSLTLVGVADRDADVAGKLAGAVGVPSSTIDELLASDVELVSICTPPDAHAALVERVARAGKHVLVEKPLTLDLATADRAVEGCEERGVLLGVVHQQRARSAARAVHELVSGGTLGRPLLAVATHTWFRTPADLARDGWRADGATGGGVLFDQAVHAIDLLVWFLGRPGWVAGAGALALDGHAAEGTVVATIGFHGGALGTLAASTVSNSARDDTTIELSATRGAVRLEIRDYDHAEIARLELARAEGERARRLAAVEIESLVRARDGGWRGGPRSPFGRLLARIGGPARGTHPFRSPRAFARREADRIAQREREEPQGHAAVLDRMAAAVRGRGEPVASGREARDGIAVLEAIVLSLRRSGARVELDGPRRDGAPVPAGQR